MLIATGIIMTINRYISVPILLAGVEARKQFRINFASYPINFGLDSRLLSSVAWCAGVFQRNLRRRRYECLPLTFVHRWYAKIRSHYRLRPCSICQANGVARIIKNMKAKMPFLFEKPDRPLSSCCLFSR